MGLTVLWLKIVALLVITSPAAVLLVRDWHFHKRDTVIHRRINGCVLSLLAAGGCLQVYVTWADLREKQASGAQIQELLSGNQQLLAGKDQLLLQNKQLLAEIREKDAKIAKLGEDVQKARQ